MECLDSVKKSEFFHIFKNKIWIWLRKKTCSHMFLEKSARSHYCIQGRLLGRSLMENSYGVAST